MAMLSARFRDDAAARRAVSVLVDDLGATASLVITSSETPLDAGNVAGISPDAAAVFGHEAIRVAIHDNAISPEAARRVFETMGGTDIAPIQ